MARQQVTIERWAMVIEAHTHRCPACRLAYPCCCRAAEGVGLCGRCRADHRRPDPADQDTVPPLVSGTQTRPGPGERANRGGEQREETMRTGEERERDVQALADDILRGGGRQGATAVRQVLVEVLRAQESRLDDYAALVALIPPCPVASHGPGCTGHAREWICAQRAKALGLWDEGPGEEAHPCVDR